MAYSDRTYVGLGPGPEWVTVYYVELSHCNSCGNLNGSCMVYSHWLGPEPEPGQGLRPVLCRTFHIAQGPGRMGCMVLIRTFHTAPEQVQGRTLVFITGHIFRT